MKFTQKLSQLIIICCFLSLSMNSIPVFATAEEPLEAATPEPTPTILPAYLEPIQTDATEGWPAGPAVYAESTLVMDADTGTILYAKNIDERKYPASITKIMTTLLAIENSTPNDWVTFSDHAIWGIERNSSHIGIRIGEVLSMKDCLYGMMLASANEVCLAVAEHISGDVPTFVEMMNRKAAELGCTNTNFTNPNGLPDEQHYTSARDMALIARAAWQNELFREVSATKTYKIGWTNKAGEARWLGNHHKMLWEDSGYYYEGCQGGKTGFTRVALNTLVTYATRDDRTLICVSMRTNGPLVYTDTAALLDYGFQNFHNITLDNTKKAEYSAYLMPYPAIFFNRYSAQTLSDLLKSAVISVPKGVTADNITVQSTNESALIQRDLSYNGYVVGTDNIRQPEGVMNLSSSSSNSNGINDTLSKDLSTSKTPPAWTYPMLGLLFVLLIIVIIKIFFFILRIKRKKRKKKRR